MTLGLSKFLLMSDLWPTTPSTENSYFQDDLYVHISHSGGTLTCRRTEPMPECRASPPPELTNPMRPRIAHHGRQQPLFQKRDICQCVCTLLCGQVEVCVVFLGENRPRKHWSQTAPKSRTLHKWHTSCGKKRVTELGENGCLLPMFLAWHQIHR